MGAPSAQYTRSVTPVARMCLALAPALCHRGPPLAGEHVLQLRFTPGSTFGVFGGRCSQCCSQCRHLKFRRKEVNEKSVCSRNVLRTTIQHCRLRWDVGSWQGCIMHPQCKESSEWPPESCSHRLA